VHHTARVWINGEDAGMRLWRPTGRRHEIAPPGKNRIRIRIGNLLNNSYGDLRLLDWSGR